MNVTKATVATIHTMKTIVSAVTNIYIYIYTYGKNWMLIKKLPSWESKTSRPHCKVTHQQLKYCGELKFAYFYGTYNLTVKKVENKNFITKKKQWSVDM
jgi:hypothetical protein